MAHKKAGGSTQLGRDSQGQRLGVKLADGQLAHPGQIIVRQRGTKVRPGMNVTRAKDDTLFATSSGIVKFYNKNVSHFNGKRTPAKFVKVEPSSAVSK